MARIRTVKPEYFQHEGIYDAEEQTKLPLRIAYVGLWTQADRRGLFRWKPRELKLNVLPYDPGDFGAILDALEAHGFIVRYQVEGMTYGWIPTLGKHQLFNIRERPHPAIPPPPEDVQCRWLNSASTVQAQSQNGVRHVGIGSGSGSGSGSGKEGKGSDPGAPGVFSLPGSGRPSRGPNRAAANHDATCLDPLCCEAGARNARNVGAPPTG